MPNARLRRRPKPSRNGTAAPATPAGGPTPAASPTRQYLGGVPFGGWGSGGGGGRGGPGVAVAGHASDPLTRQMGPQQYDAMLPDPAVAASINTLKLSILGDGYSIIPAATAPPDAGFRPPSPADQDRIDRARHWAQFVERSFARPERTLRSVCLELLDCCWCASKLAEVEVEVAPRGVDKGALVLKDLRPLPRDAWAWALDALGRVVGVVGRWLPGADRADAATLDGQPFLPLDHVVLMTWAPTGGDPRGSSVLYPAYSAWQQKVQVIQEFFLYLRLFGRPKPVVSPAAETVAVNEYDAATGQPTGRQITAYDALMAVFAGWGTNEYYVVPPGTLTTFLQATGNGEAFHSALDWYDRQILMAVLGTAAGTMESRRNSQAQAGVGQDRVDLNVWQGRDLLARRLEKLAWKLIELNAGADEADAFGPAVRVGGAPHEDKAKMITAWTGAGWSPAPDQFPAIDADVGLPPRQADPAAAAALARELALAQATAGPAAATAQGPPPAAGA
jgi:hypothetical protein